MTRRIRTAAAIVALSALMAGCQTPGTAATVNGERISDREVSEAVSDLTALSAGQPIAASDIVQMLAMEKIMGDVAEEYDFAVSHEEILSAFNSGAAAGGGQALDPATTSDAAVDALRFNYYLQTLQTLPNFEEVNEAVGVALEEAEIEINPRYGVEYSADQYTFVPIANEWIASAN